MYSKLSVVHSQRPPARRFETPRTIGPRRDLGSTLCVKCNPSPTIPRPNREADPMPQEVLPFPPTPSASIAGRTMQEST